MEPARTTPRSPAPRRLPAWGWAAGAIAVGACAWLLLRGPAATTPEPGLSRAEPSRRATTPLEPPPAAPLLPPGPAAPPPRRAAAPEVATVAAQVRGIVLDEAERPFAGAQVVLHALDPAAVRGVPFPDGERLAATQSDRDGAFTLPAPTTPLARLTASASGRASASVRVDPAGARLTLRLVPEAVLAVEVLDAEGAAVPDAAVEVQVGQVTVTAAAGDGGRAEVHALPQGLAAVRVRSATRGAGGAGPLHVVQGERREVLVTLARAVPLAGVVRDAGTRAPVAGAAVVLAQPGRAVASATTDAQGRFTAAGGARGERLVVSITADGYRALLEPATLEASGEGAEREFELEPARAWVGRVEDALGNPVVGARVGYTADGVAGHVPASAVSDAHGGFVLPAPPPPAPGRRVVLTATGPGGRAALALRPEQPAPEPLVLRLSSGATVRGTVRTPAGEPVADVVVHLQPAWDRIADRSGADLLHAVNAERAGGLSALTGADGVWSLGAVPFGTWRLALERGGSYRRSEEPVTVAQDEVDLGASTWGGGLAVHGRVLFAGGRAAPGASVQVVGARGEPAGPGTSADALGRFALDGLAPGKHRLSASLGGDQRASVEVELAEPDTAQDLVLPAPAVLALEVEHDGSPYRGPLSVTLGGQRFGGEPGYRETRRVRDGKATFEGVPAGTWSAVLEAPGGLRALLPPLQLAPGQTAAARATLKAEARLAGVLLDARGQPARSGVVKLAAGGSDPERSTRVDARGRFAFDGLSRARRTLTAAGAGGAPVEREVAPEPGPPPELELRLDPAGAIEVRVRDAAGRAIPGALLAVRPVDAAVAWLETSPLRTDAAGKARRADLPVGVVRVRARSSDGLEGAASATVVAGQTTTVEITVAAR